MVARNKKPDVAAAAEWVDIGVLVPWEHNPRINDHAVARVAASIKEFGWAEVIVARKADNMVISGHTRLKAAQKLGLTSVPVRFLDVTDRQARQLALAANKLGEIAAWDDEKLSAVLSELSKEAEALEVPFDFDALGFSKLEMDALLHNPGAWGGDDAVDPNKIGDYDPNAETFVIKIAEIKAADKDNAVEVVNAALAAAGLAYTAKAF